MSRHPARLTLAALLALIGLRWIVNSNPWSGPTVLTLSDSHGVHMNDWFSYVCWTAAVLVAMPQRTATVVPLPSTRRRDG
jgi:hypothetical protein